MAEITIKYPVWFLVAIALAMCGIAIMVAVSLICEYRLKRVRMKRVLLQEIKRDMQAMSEPGGQQ
jgi:hypothetical protein